MVKSPLHSSGVSIWSNAFVQWRDILSTLGKIWPCWQVEEDPTPTDRTRELRPICYSVRHSEPSLCHLLRLKLFKVLCKRILASSATVLMNFKCRMQTFKNWKRADGRPPFTEQQHSMQFMALAIMLSSFTSNQKFKDLVKLLISSTDMPSFFAISLSFHPNQNGSGKCSSNFPAGASQSHQSRP